MPTMPDVIGMNYQEAQDALQAAGVYVAYPVYAFLSAPQISVQWGAGGFPGEVIGQSPLSGGAVQKGAPITLTLAPYPMGAVVSPGY